MIPRGFDPGEEERSIALEPYREKIASLEEVRKRRLDLKALGKQVVFTNGCFDLLHPGHARYLCQARALGDHLVVAVNSDRSVRSIKGPERPVMPQSARAEMIAALAFVDSVLIFDQDDPLMVIRALVPDVLVKGGDWEEDRIIGADVVKEAGGRVVRIPFVEGFSTTGIIEKLTAAGS
ncbi:MAG: D-glycero-beta-D-manno-heptose 1-phosphate adenylyltransferase [Deltaproteobacteria bacterium]|nr:D-glycero-beta-D-manno-heptose 1-phosphate adenylyltransferase [Deltaproteobacteria bacterium]MBW1922582.1 D-glycero-beta-D-manno-heptose 1-phosphate adenylyltransferase [Deltaproteobacteria bacterium]MBW1950461.1 D-glycero-beta-D-manno-heptose 1-phosphate adenylyltransferase [Deltaproteobacteria bacterium]MBW2007777.1 D-glycero-beta-D-manno-heptose 1-phosphate adenylyltransferase [Deltaproteobacteria bacterium]MBW2101571.1 D-glycero-beta-D-manno-heptose 1-phosphate adenylyltransferase [Delt